VAINILGGYAKGFSIDLPLKVSFRPTSVILRRKIFDKFQDWENIFFMDLCGGSGALGLEALSRGACGLFYADNQTDVLKIFSKNVEKFKKTFSKNPDFVIDEKMISCHKMDLLKIDSWLEMAIEKILIAQEKITQVFIFIDPPYDDINCYNAVYEWFLKKSKKISSLNIENRKIIFTLALEYDQRNREKWKKNHIFSDGLEMNSSQSYLYAGDRTLSIYHF